MPAGTLVISHSPSSSYPAGNKQLRRNSAIESGADACTASDTSTAQYSASMPKHRENDEVTELHQQDVICLECLASLAPENWRAGMTGVTSSSKPSNATRHDILLMSFYTEPSTSTGCSSASADISASADLTLRAILYVPWAKNLRPVCTGTGDPTS